MEEEIGEALDRAAARKPYERSPDWAEKVQPIEPAFKIATEDGVITESKEDNRADKEFEIQNILLCTPHIFSMIQTAPNKSSHYGTPYPIRTKSTRDITKAKPRLDLRPRVWQIKERRHPYHIRADIPY